MWRQLTGERQTQHWNTLRHNSAPITIWPRLSLAHTYLASRLFSHAPCRATDDRWTSRSAQEKKRRINFMALGAVRLRCCLMTSCQSLDVLPTCRGIGGEGVCFLEWDMAKEWLTAVRLPAKSGVCIKEGAVPYRVISRSQHSAAVISNWECSWPTSSAFLYPPAKWNATGWVTGPFIITRTVFFLCANQLYRSPTQKLCMICYYSHFFVELTGVISNW